MRGSHRIEASSLLCQEEGVGLALYKLAAGTLLQTCNGNKAECLWQVVLGKSPHSRYQHAHHTRHYSEDEYAQAASEDDKQQKYDNVGQNLVSETWYVEEVQMSGPNLQLTAMKAAQPAPLVYA